MTTTRRFFCLFLSALLTACATPSPPAFDVLLRGGSIYDGSGSGPFKGEVAIAGDRIVAIGRDLGIADLVIDAEGRAVSPGFINILSWANESLIEDGRSQSDIRQGVTLEVMGEGWSMGPIGEHTGATPGRVVRGPCYSGTR